MWDGARAACSLSDMPKHRGEVETPGTCSRGLEGEAVLLLEGCSHGHACLTKTGWELVTKDFPLSAHKRVFVLFVRFTAFGFPVPVLSVDVSHWKQLSSSNACAPQETQSRELVANWR